MVLVPVTVNPPEPVVFNEIPLDVPLDEMLWKVSPLPPMVVAFTFSAVAAELLIELPVPCTVTVPPPVALKPVPLVVVMASPPLVKLMVAPVLEVRLTPVELPELILFVEPLKFTMAPPLLLPTVMPVPPPEELMFPVNATEPPVREVTLTAEPAVLVMAPL